MTRNPNTPPRDDAPSPSPWRSFAVLLAGGFITLLDVSILNVSIPSISHSLHMGGSGVQAIMAGYSLVFGLILVPGGRLGDVYGRRRLFIIGLILFGLASIGCGVSQNAHMLITLRLAQGIGAALVNPQMLGLTQQLFSGADRARAFGYLGLTIGIATAIGPTLGGIFIAVFGAEGGWRAAFLVNVPIIIVVIPLARKFLPAHPPREEVALGLDLGGLALLTLSVVALMAPFLAASNREVGLAHAPWWLAVISAVGFTAFFALERAQERRGRSVIAPRALLRTPSFMFGTLTQMLYAAGFTAVFIIYTLYLQQGVGLQAWQAGLMQIPIAAGSAIAAPFAGRLVSRVGRPLVVAGTAVVALATAAMATIAHTVPHAAIVPAIGVAALVLGLGSGATMAPNQALAVEHVPVATGSTAGGLYQTMQRVGSAIGIAIVTLAFYSTLSEGDITGPAAANYPAFARAFAWGTGTIAVFVALACLVAIGDAWRVHKHPGPR